MHTQGEINPSIDGLDRCMDDVGVEAVDLKEFRPMDLDWFQNVIDNYYRTDYEYLVQNDPRFPDPDELLSKVKLGNVEFQGDVRFETDGSNLIKEAILRDDPRQLIICNWGGFNTTCRALMSIYEEYGDTEDWDAMEKAIGDKLMISGTGQDNSMEDNHIREIYPDLKSYGGTGLNLGYYRSYSAPVVTAENLDLIASAGDTVTMKAQLSDPDGNALHVNWFVYNRASEYYGEERDTLAVASEEGITTETSTENTVVIPADAQTGDYLVVICRVQDDSFAPMTRYAEYVIEIQ